MTPSTTDEGRETPADRHAALLDAVRDDPRLTPAEKETTIRFARDEDRAKIFTAEAGIGRRLLAHPAASIDAVVVIGGDRARPAVSPDELDPENPRPIVGVRGAIPVGALLVRRDAREAGHHADVITETVLAEVRQ